MIADVQREPCSDCGSTTGRCEHELCARCRMVGPDHMPGDDDCRRTDAWVQALIAAAEQRAAARALEQAIAEIGRDRDNCPNKVRRQGYGGALYVLKARAAALDPAGADSGEGR